jgi:DNA damage-binding protein 1
MNPEEPEPSAGRLLVLAVDSSSGRPSLRVVCEASVRGGVFSVACIQGRIVAGVNASVVVYRCVSTGVLGASSSSASSSALVEGACRIEKECDYTGNVLVLHLSVSRDHQYVMVGDMMKGVCMLHYSSSLSGSGVQSAHGASSLSEVARDYEAHWLTALSSFSDRDDICIFADHYFNLVTVRRQTDAASEEERGRMECVGRWHAGEMINKIARGSLVMQLPDDAAAESSSAAGAFDRVVPTHVYGSINGAVGVLAPLSLTSYKFFARLEEELEKVSAHNRTRIHALSWNRKCGVAPLSAC